MGIKVYKPTTSGRRKMSGVDYSGLSKNRKTPKHLLKSKAKSGGRNQQGKITVRHIGGGHKKKIRVIDNVREKFDIPAKIESIEYDPNRSAFISLVVYRDGERRYILTPLQVRPGNVIVSSKSKPEIRPGNRTLLKYMPAGTFVHDIEVSAGKGGQIVRGAGTYATVMAAEGDSVILKLPSGEIRRIAATNMATIGQVSNPDNINVRVGKAGRRRWMGIKPTVRGKVMNPVDHPHGGGEGRNPIGLKYPKTPWGKHALGVKTRKKYKSSDKFIIQRRKKK